MLISEILNNCRYLREINYNEKLSSEDIEVIVNEIYPFVGFRREDVTTRDVALFHKAMKEGRSEIDFENDEL